MPVGVYTIDLFKEYSDYLDEYESIEHLMVTSGRDYRSYSDVERGYLITLEVKEGEDSIIGVELSMKDRVIKEGYGNYRVDLTLENKKGRVYSTTVYGEGLPGEKLFNIELPDHILQESGVTDFEVENVKVNGVGKGLQGVEGLTYNINVVEGSFETITINLIEKTELVE